MQNPGFTHAKPGLFVEKLAQANISFITLP
jgi:hypothetical protein